MEDSKFILDGVTAKKVDGFTNDPKLLSEAVRRFAEANKETFDRYDTARRKSIAHSQVLDSFREV